MSESQLEEILANWLQLYHPNLIYRFDSSSSLKLNSYQSNRLSKLYGKKSRGYPDFQLLESVRPYIGLFIELKIKSPFKKDGTLRKDKHLEEQNEYHKLLREKGYYVTFSTGFEETKDIVERYLYGKI